MGRNKVIVITLISIMLLAAFTAVAGAQMMRRHGFRHHRPGMMRMAAGLQLTPEQKTTARAIFQQAKKDAAAVFTPEQRDQLAQMRQGRRGRMHHQRGQRGQALNLTPEQKEKMQAIRRDARTKMQAMKNDAALSREDKVAQVRAIHQSVREQMQQVLTPEQQQQLRQRMQQGPARKLNLTDEQKAQLKTIRDKAMEQFRGILTPEQQKQIDARRERMQQRMEYFRQRQQAPAAK